MKARIAALLLAGAVGAAALAASAPAGTSGPSACEKTIVGVAAGDKRFSTLVTLVKQAGLVKTLNGMGNFTVFAPTNAAFAKLKKAAPKTYAAVASDKALLTKVLTYHVLATPVPALTAVGAAMKKGTVKTVEGERIKLSLRDGGLYLNGTSRVIIGDVNASNGVVHAINTVLVPPSLS